MKIKKKMVFLTAFLGLSLLSAVYAATSDPLKVINHISLGDINIKISELSREGTVETAYREPETILPGDHISKIVRIHNQAMPCWIRVRLTYKSDTEQSLLNDGYLQGMSSDWVKRGNYFYYTQVLEEKASADLIQGIMIPESWTEAVDGEKTGVEILAQAIQAANFTPDFTVDQPWGNQKIEECVHEENGSMTSQKSVRKLTVELQGSAGKLLAVPDDFFVNFGFAMPGDVLTDTIQISNTTDHTADLYFMTDTSGRTKEQLKLLKEMRLSIYLDEKLVFRGSLASDTLKKSHLLGTYKAGAQKEMSFRLELPSSWDNDYALKMSDITWIFKAAWGNSGTGGSPSGSGNEPAGTKNSSAKKKNSAKTGDESDIEFWILAASGAGAMLAVILRTGFRKKGENRK